MPRVCSKMHVSWSRSARLPRRRAESPARSGFALLLFGLAWATCLARGYDCNGDGRVVGLALSGGGLRATGIAYGALLQLHEDHLLDRIDLVSAASGGTIIGAYYCLKLPLNEFEEKIQNSLFAASLMQVLSPKNLVDGIRNDRTWGFKEALDKIFYSGKKLTDLRECPSLLICATNFDNSSLFVFSREGAADENLTGRKDLTQYKMPESRFRKTTVSFAVASACAFPSVMKPSVLEAVPEAPEKGDQKRKAKEIHLVDGGIFDNQGIEALLLRRCDVIISIDSSAPLITNKGYRHFTPGGTKAIPMLRMRYMDLLQAYARNQIGANYIHIPITDKEVIDMGIVKTRLKKKELALLIKHGREIVKDKEEELRSRIGH